MSRRGMTLLEVQAATALLVVLTSACVPLLTQIGRSAAPIYTTAVEDVRRLGLAISALADDDQLLAGTLFLETLGEEPVHVTELSDEVDTASGGGWLLCTWRGVSILHWIEPVEVAVENSP